MIGDGEPAFVIAEAGINHNGDVDLAIELIDLAAGSGADAVKFQTFHADQFCGDPDLTFTYKSQGREVTEPMREMFRRMELPDHAWKALSDHCATRGITFMTTPQDVADFELVRPLGLPAIKVGSDDLTNSWLLSRYAKSDLPMILSSGMAQASEIADALATVGWPGFREVAVLVCTSVYPAPPETANLGRITTLTSQFPGLTVGFSDHTQGDQAARIARALGAVIFEKHFTLSHDLPGPDHWFSADPDELSSWVSTIRETDTYVGSGVVEPCAAEIPDRTRGRRSITALRDIAAGEVLTELNIGLRRPGGGVDSSRFDDWLGRPAARSIRAWKHVLPEDVGGAAR